MRIGVEIDHRKAIAIYREAKGDPRAYPRIPEGCNTYWEHFVTADGQPALAITQRGFARLPEDKDAENNGCSVAVVLDSCNSEIARATLDSWAREMLPEARA